MVWFLVYYLVGLVSGMHIINVDTTDGCMTGENPLLLTSLALLMAVFAPGLLCYALYVEWVRDKYVRKDIFDL